MNVLTKILGVLLIIGGIIAGLWIDIKILLIGGIMQALNGLDATPHNNHDIAVGIVKVLCAGVGGFVTVIAIIAGVCLIMYGSVRRPKRRPLNRRF